MSGPADGLPIPRIPPETARAVSARWPDRGQRWCAAVSTELSELCVRLDAHPTKVMDARYGFVVAIVTGHGSELVLKSTPDPAGPRQARAASVLADLKVGPAVHEIIESATGTWTVLERIFPGDTAFDPPLEQLVNALRPLLAEVPNTGEFPTVSAWLRERLIRVDDTDLAPGASAASSTERGDALRLLDELVTNESITFCHGDLQPGNVIHGENQLMLIDPRAVSGDIEYDVAVFATKTNLSPSRLANKLGVNAERAKAWAEIAVTARV